MKIYISLPITGHDIGVVEFRCSSAQAGIEEKGHTPVSPLELDHGDPEDYEAVIGTDITALLCCDAILLLNGWENSKGCRLEAEAATIYGKRKFFGLDEIPADSCVNTAGKIIEKLKTENT